MAMLFAASGCASGGKVAAPATITGQVLVQSEHYRHEIEIENAGWHWIEMERETGDRLVLKRFTGNTDKIEFMVLLVGGVST